MHLLSGKVIMRTKRAKLIYHINNYACCSNWIKSITFCCFFSIALSLIFTAAQAPSDANNADNRYVKYAVAFVFPTFAHLQFFTKTYPLTPNKNVTIL